MQHKDAAEFMSLSSTFDLNLNRELHLSILFASLFAAG